VFKRCRVSSIGNERLVGMDRLVVFFCFLFVAVQDVYASSKIFIAYAGVTSGVATLWISEEQGFFRKYGVDADVIAVRNTPTQLAALISGDIQIGFGGGSAARQCSSISKVFCCRGGAGWHRPENHRHVCELDDSQYGCEARD
jgi:hypothetical protein